MASMLPLLLLLLKIVSFMLAMNKCYNTCVCALVPTVSPQLITTDSDVEYVDIFFEVCIIAIVEYVDIFFEVCIIAVIFIHSSVRLVSRYIATLLNTMPA